MKRKIERYLGNGNDENICYLEDGRFDFGGDMEGVLFAVRQSEGKRSTSGKKSTRTPSNKKTYFASNAYRNRNSASRILFEDQVLKTPHHPVHESKSMDYFTDNIFASPDPVVDCSDVVVPSQQNPSAIQSKAGSGQTSILRTPQFKASSKSPTVMGNSLIKTPASEFDMKGFTPLSTYAKSSFVESEMLAYGLFSPDGPLGNDFVMEEVKTPKASDNPRVCIANVRFGDETTNLDKKQRNVSISPIKSTLEIFEKRKRQPLFYSSCKKRKNVQEDRFAHGLVTPSLSVSSGTTIATVPLTVCSSASSARASVTMEEFGKIRLLEISSSGFSANKSAVSSPFDRSEPKHITQDTPNESQLFSPPLKLDKLPGSILRSTKKTDVCTPAEKFWSSVGGLDNFTPFRENTEEVRDSSLTSPTSNSEIYILCLFPFAPYPTSSNFEFVYRSSTGKFIHKLLNDDKGSVSTKPILSSTMLNTDLSAE